MDLLFLARALLYSPIRALHPSLLTTHSNRPQADHNKARRKGCVCLLVLRSTRTGRKMVPMKATKRVVQRKKPKKANGAVVAAKIMDNGGKTVPRLNFCFVLHKFLTEQSNGTTVEWSPCGTRFFLRPEDPEQFSELLKPYFRRKCLLLLAEDPWQCWSAAHGALHCHWSTGLFYFIKVL